MIGTLCGLADTALTWSEFDAPVAFFDRPCLEGAAPPRIRSRRLRDSLVRSWRYMLKSRPEESLACVASIASQLQALEPGVADRYRTQIQLIRAYGKALLDDPAGLLLELSEVLPDSGYSDLIRVMRRFAYWRLLRWTDLYALPMSGPTASANEASARIFDLVILAAAAFERLQLITASRFAADAISLAESAQLESSVAAASAAVVLASIRYELGYLEHAEQLVLSQLPIILDRGAPDVIIAAYTLMSRIAQHRGRVEHAAVVLNEGEALGERKSCPRIVLSMMTERVRLLIRRDDVERASKENLAIQEYAKTLSVAPEPQCEVASLCALAHLQTMVAEGQFAQATAALYEMLDNTNRAQKRYTAFRLTLELLGALNASAEDNQSSSILVDALKTGEGAGLLQCWVDANRSCVQLMGHVAEQLPHASSADFAALQAYIRTIVAHQSMSPFAHQRKRRSALCVSARLSVRERTVLVLIAQGHSNKRAARTLRVTPETIKSHLKRVFVKLGAQTRAEAVSRAADLGQLIGIFVPSRSKSASGPL